MRLDPTRISDKIIAWMDRHEKVVRSWTFLLFLVVALIAMIILIIGLSTYIIEAIS
jgi:hypothetical protein